MQFQVHYSNHSGENVKDRTSIGLVFAKEPVKHEIGQYEIWNNLFLIPPNADNQRSHFMLHLAERCHGRGLHRPHAFPRERA